MQASEIWDADDYLVERQLEAQIVIGQGHAHALKLAVRQLRAVTLYWLVAGTVAAMAAIGIGWLAVASVRADMLREKIVVAAPGPIFLATLFTGLLCIALACIARAIGLRGLAGEAEMLHGTNQDAVHAGIASLDRKR
jgi:hypothetical protein